ncbi:MAG: addiction module protein [Desulfobacteraceae bacterium]|nr:addiction module protein [Desulfobacteraceae bacterium]
MTINLQNMTTKEKLMTMELLWDDLCKNQINFASPSWHEIVLNGREKAVADGKDEFEDWEDAKKEILNRIK